MIQAEQCFIDCINSPVRSVLGRVELFEGSTLLHTFKYTDRLKSFSVERLGDGKFFGYGICHKLNVKLIDKDKELDIHTGHTLEAVFGTHCDYIYPFPLFYVTEVHRNENTNELSITAYDALHLAASITVNQLSIGIPYSIREFAIACAAALGLPFGIENMEESAFDIEYDIGANFSGQETVREALNAVAEATQSIYFINHNWQLTFKRLDIAGEAVAVIDKEKYFTLDSGTNRRLTGICHTTELGDNMAASLELSGTTQYIRENPFYNLRDDLGELLESALAAVGGLTINQFSCNWRGNYLLEPGDKIGLVTKDNQVVYSYLLNDSIHYDGFLSQDTEWEYSNDEDTEEVPASVIETVNLTYAKVDKQNNIIDLVASQVDSNSESISGLLLTAESIDLTVSNVSEKVDTELLELTEELATVSNKVNAAVTAEDLTIQISAALENGVAKVETTTGFTFNDEGLRISKSGTEMETAITENGMTVYRDSEAVLIADHEGVQAEDLQATTFLIISNKSRFESYGDRIGCFWIGG